MPRPVARNAETQRESAPDSEQGHPSEQAASHIQVQAMLRLLCSWHSWFRDHEIVVRHSAIRSSALCQLPTLVLKVNEVNEEHRTQ
jgi:hypothetical protein